MLLFLEGSFLVANDFMIYMFLRVSFYLWLFSSFLWVYIYCFSVYIFIWVSLNIFFVYICFTLLHPITCPIPLSSNALQSRRCFGFDTSWCVSCLDSGAKTVPDCCGISLTSVSFCCCYFTCSWTGSSMGLAACCMFVTCLGTPFFCSNKYSFVQGILYPLVMIICELNMFLSFINMSNACLTNHAESLPEFLSSKHRHLCSELCVFPFSYTFFQDLLPVSYLQCSHFVAWVHHNSSSSFLTNNVGVFSSWL